jgi:hypothetical protein
MAVMAAKFTLLLTLPVFCGILCAADSAAGHYVLEGTREVGSELLLTRDGNFQFVLAYGAMDLMARGTWRQEGDTVILNSTLSQEPVFRMSRGSSNSPASLRVTVKGADGQPAERIDVILNGPAGSSRGKTDEHGVAVFQDLHSAQSVSFHVPVYDFEAGPFPLDAAHNDFEFVVNGEAIMQVPFREERLKIQGNTLDLRFFDRGTAMVYKKP